MDSSLPLQVLNTVPKHRATINQVKAHQWFTKNFQKATGRLVYKIYGPLVY